MQSGNEPAALASERETDIPEGTLRHYSGFLVALLISALAYASMVRLHWLNGTLRDQVTTQTIFWYALAFMAYMWLLIWAERREVAMRWVWVGAIGWRLMLLFTTPTLSDDVFRYMWEGHLSSEGVNPYLHRVEAPELDHLAIPLRSQVNNPWMASPYLPAAQWVFRFVASNFPFQPVFFQASMVLFELLGASLIAILLKKAALPPRRLILYLWNPLTVIEIAHGAHVDALMLSLALAAVWATWRWIDKGPGIASMLGKFAAPLLHALATLTKIIPVLLLPVLFWRWSWLQRTFYILVILVILIPYAIEAGWGLTGPKDGIGLFGAARIYADQWSFNSGLFYSLEKSLGERGLGNPMRVARNLMVFGLSVAVVVTWIRSRKTSGIRHDLRLATVPLMAYLLLTTTLHPWYMLILLVFLPFLPPGDNEPRRLWLLIVPWVYLSATVVTSYLTYLDPADYVELPWVRRLEWFPTWGLLASNVVILYLSRRRDKGSSPDRAADPAAPA